MSDVTAEAKGKMDKTVDVLRREFSTMRAGRATPSLLERVLVDYYGTPTPVNQLGQVTAPEPRLLVVQPWDKSVVPEVEKAILKSDLGLTPSSDGSVIRLAIPQLTEERRKELVRAVHKKAEEEKVALRNLRREAIDVLQKRQKAGEMSEDELHRGQEEIQHITDEHVKKIDELAAAKEKEVLEV